LPSIRAAIARTFAVTWLLPLACAAARPSAPVGVSDATPDAPAPAKVSVPHAVWPDFAAARTWPEAAPAVVALAHRRDGTRIHVRVEPPSIEQYRSLAVDAPMPEGARVAAFHESPSGELLGVSVLAKRAASWTALELDARGTVIAGDGAACLRCHDLAPTDHLFGVSSRLPGQPASPAQPAQPGN
jgi:hypothetical protein